jgi:hypothetical protein
VGESSVTQVPEPLSPRNRSRVRNCQAPTGTTTSSMNRYFTGCVGRSVRSLASRAGGRC